MAYVLSKGVTYRQAVTLGITTLFLSFFGAFYLGTFYLGSRTGHALNLFLLATGFSVLVNWIYARVFDVSVENDRLYLRNLYYGKLVIEGKDFESISSTQKLYQRFLPSPFMSPPYFAIRLKSGKKYLFLDMSIKALATLFTFNSDKHAKYLTRLVHEHLN